MSWKKTGCKRQQQLVGVEMNTSELQRIRSAFGLSNGDLATVTAGVSLSLDALRCASVEIVRGVVRRIGRLCSRRQLSAGHYAGQDISWHVYTVHYH